MFLFIILSSFFLHFFFYVIYFGDFCDFFFFFCFLVSRLFEKKLRFLDFGNLVPKLFLFEHGGQQDVAESQVVARGGERKAGSTDSTVPSARTVT